VLAAFAPSAAWLIAARAGMGVFGAMLMPSTLSAAQHLHRPRPAPHGDRGVGVDVLRRSGPRPIVGGILLEHFAWGSVFLMSVPVLVPLLILAPLLVPESRDPRPGRIDPISIALSMLTMVPIVYAIKEVAVHGFGVLPVVLTAAGSASASFVRRQLASSSRCSTCGCSRAAPSAARCW
jgi:DHA2 family multidrug resistance protein-like MFS transporter